MHFLQESYEFVQKSQSLQVCYSVEHFSQESDNIFAKFESNCKKFLQKMRCYFDQKFLQNFLDPGSIKDAFRHRVS